MKWAPLKTIEFGDVWHLVRHGANAHCDKRKRLRTREASDQAPVLDGVKQVCQRCLGFADKHHARQNPA